MFPSSDYHDGEDDSAVLVNITSSHAEDPVRGPGRGEGGQGQLDGLGVAVGWWVGGVLKHIIILQPAGVTFKLIFHSIIILSHVRHCPHKKDINLFDKIFSDHNI